MRGKTRHIWNRRKWPVIPIIVVGIITTATFEHLGVTTLNALFLLCGMFTIFLMMFLVLIINVLIESKEERKHEEKQRPNG